MCQHSYICYVGIDMSVCISISFGIGVNISISITIRNGININCSLMNKKLKIKLLHSAAAVPPSSKELSMIYESKLLNHLSSGQGAKLVTEGTDIKQISE